jgi:vinculin
MNYFFTGEQATKLVVAEGRKVADSCTGPQRSELLRLCDETEILTNQLSDLINSDLWGPVQESATFLPSATTNLVACSPVKK